MTAVLCCVEVVGDVLRGVELVGVAVASLSAVPDVVGVASVEVSGALEVAGVAIAPGSPVAVPVVEPAMLLVVGVA